MRSARYWQLPLVRLRLAKLGASSIFNKNLSFFGGETQFLAIWKCGSRKKKGELYGDQRMSVKVRHCGSLPACRGLGAKPCMVAVP